MNLKRILTSGVAALALTSSTALAEKPKGYISVSGDYARELSSRSHFDTYLQSIQDALKVRDPLSSDGFGATVCGGILLGKGYGLELEVSGILRPSSTHGSMAVAVITEGSTSGNAILVNETLQSHVDYAEYRGEAWLNAFREFYPFPDKSSLYLGLGAGILMDKIVLDFGYHALHYAGIGERYTYHVTGIGYGAKLFAGSAFQIYRNLFFNLRSGLKVGRMKFDIEEIGTDAGIIPNKSRKGILAWGVDAGLEWRF